MTQRSTDISRRRFLQGVTGGAAVAAASGSASAQEGTTHTVDMTDDLVFDPDSITVAPGDTVVWENVGNVGHSVTAYEGDIPAEAAYFASGEFDTEQAARNAYEAGDPSSGDVAGGESYQHTFETEGDYEYFCVPHETVGMIGSVEVVPGGAGPVEELLPSIPDAAKTLALGVTFVFASVLALVYFFLKYGERGPAAETDRSERRSGGT